MTNWETFFGLFEKTGGGTRIFLGSSKLSFTNGAPLTDFGGRTRKLAVTRGLNFGPKGFVRGANENGFGVSDTCGTANTGRGTRGAENTGRGALGAETTGRGGDLDFFG